MYHIYIYKSSIWESILIILNLISKLWNHISQSIHAWESCDTTPHEVSVGQSPRSNRICRSLASPTVDRGPWTVDRGPWPSNFESSGAAPGILVGPDQERAWQQIKNHQEPKEKLTLMKLGCTLVHFALARSLKRGSSAMQNILQCKELPSTRIRVSDCKYFCESTRIGNDPPLNPTCWWHLEWIMSHVTPQQSKWISTWLFGVENKTRAWQNLLRLLRVESKGIGCNILQQLGADLLVFETAKHAEKSDIMILEWYSDTISLRAWSPLDTGGSQALTRVSMQHLCKSASKPSRCACCSASRHFAPVVATTPQASPFSP